MNSVQTYEMFQFSIGNNMRNGCYGNPVSRDSTFDIDIDPSALCTKLIQTRDMESK